MTRETCPSCRGAKIARGFITRTDGCGVGEWPCTECKGTGTVEAGSSERRRLGDTIRARRTALGMTMGDAADAAEMSVAEWSGAERGHDAAAQTRADLFLAAFEVARKVVDEHTEDEVRAYLDATLEGPVREAVSTAIDGLERDRGEGG